jgi:hypothetical protein
LLPGSLDDILSQLLQVFPASAGQIEFTVGEIPVEQEALLLLGAEASCPTDVLKLLSPLSPEGLNSFFLPETERD